MGTTIHVHADNVRLRRERDELASRVEELEQEVERLEGAIATHNKECDFLCVNDKHCDHRPRQCASCPKDWKVNI